MERGDGTNNQVMVSRCASRGIARPPAKTSEAGELGTHAYCRRRKKVGWRAMVH